MPDSWHSLQSQVIVYARVTFTVQFIQKPRDCLEKNMDISKASSCSRWFLESDMVVSHWMCAQKSHFIYNSIERGTSKKLRWICILLEPHRAPESVSSVCLGLRTKGFPSIRRLPYMGFTMCHFDNAYTTSQPTIVHSAVQPPCVSIRIKHFNGLQVRCAIKASHCH